MSGISKYTHTSGPGGFPASVPPVKNQPGGDGSKPAAGPKPGPSGPANTPAKQFAQTEAGKTPGAVPGPQGSDPAHPLNMFAGSQNSIGAKGVQGAPHKPDDMQNAFGLTSPRINPSRG